jgi:hypothetical protein
MPRKRTRRKLHKPHEKRVDLTAYQRLMRFLRYMSPTLSATDVLRMLPESDGWSVQQLKERATKLSEDLAIWSLAHLIPDIVTGAWGWGMPLPHGAHSMIDPTEFPREFAWGSPAPRWGDAFTVERLCRLAGELREVLQDVVAGDAASAGERIRRHLGGQIVLQRLLTPEQGFQWPTSRDERLSFDRYCFWLMTKLLVEGHRWRVATCVQCGGFFLKTRRDPPDRPSRFCSDQCRRDWHNPRRPKKGSGQP